MVQRHARRYGSVIMAMSLTAAVCGTAFAGTASTSLAVSATVLDSCSVTIGELTDTRKLTTCTAGAGNNYRIYVDSGTERISNGTAIDGPDRIQIIGDCSAPIACVSEPPGVTLSF